MALTARTNVEVFMFAVKGKLEHTMEVFFTASEKASRYLLHGMKKDTSDIVKDFESYAMADVEGIANAIISHALRLMARRAHFES
jgi:predicted transposase YbfD/YdcC